MFDRVIQFSLNNRLLVSAVAAFVVVYGGYVLTKLPVDVFPDLNRPTVTIMTEAEGLAPEEVEALVTLPIETSVNGAHGVRRVRSSSGIGLSIVWVEFDWGIDIYAARRIVGEKLQQVRGRLPEGIAPVLAPISSIMGEIMLIGMTADPKKVSSLELRSLAEWDVRRRLLSIPGISQVTVIGGDLKQYQVLVSPQKLHHYGLGLDQLEEAVEKASANTTGGFMRSDYTESLIRNLGRVQSVDDISTAVLAERPGSPFPLTIGDVAEVRVGAPIDKRGDAGVDGGPGVILSVQKQPGADTVELTRRVEAELASLEAGFPEGVTIHSEIFRQSAFIERSVENVRQALLDGSILVVIVLFIFLMNFRTTFITLTAIPLSLLITFIVFHFFGLSINTMTLGGLAVAIGELVDDSIVDVENVFRRLRENRQRTNPRPMLTVVFEASKEIRNSIVFATIIVVLVFVPLFAMGGVEGRIFAPLGIAYIVSIIASLFVSLTVTPVLCSYLLPGLKQMSHGKDSWLVRQIKETAARVLNWAFPRTFFVLSGVTLLFILTALCVPFFGREFLPTFNEGSLTINVMAPPGTSIAESNRIAAIAEREILKVPETVSTGRRTGRAEMDEHALEVYATEIETELAPSDRSRAEIFRDIRERLSEIPGIGVSIGQPISHRIDHMLSGVRAQVAVKIFGDDLSVLREKAEEVKSAMARVPGVVDLDVEKQTLIPQVHVRVNREQTRQYGLKVGDVAEFSELALHGREVAQVLEGQRVYDIVLRLDDTARKDIDSVRNMHLNINGQDIPLRLVADVEEAKGPNLINRENAQRRIVVQANVDSRDLVGTVEAIQRQVAQDVAMPPGYYITYGGQFESQVSASRLIALLSLISFGGMYLVLYAHFRSAMFALQIMVNIPLAFIGAVVGVIYTGGVFSIASMVGFITLTGISARNGIMMLSHYLHLMQHEGERFDKKMILRGTQERLVPVLMTALTAMLALTPLVIAAGEPGKEILHPVAVVIFAGLFSSTALDLIVTPLIFYRFARRSVAQLVPEAVEQSRES
ncbi:MAG: efflux RND transporter permease subunit [Verrucomicrobiota bacterium]